ncbi:leucine-rich repeat-containing protein [Cavenderia fasciculata]|uniref:Leucine-rich repeat-containing protein n=1 Tax=Cavenderia fasciculata TaxID=261658 RepID=F4PU57_CACFS|nr:leucine-rich repeat-containing protein [Cavenderia fasciculata]EGG20983.1 leucine-rich repeat-containing protein [Cavenderia fasciculata]|eukprot:XP_004358833.1 leucine-rich repeat-containing protein [Cavenderia fasciculata]
MTKNENRVKGIESTSSTSIDSNNNQQNNNNEQLVPKIFIESIDDLHIDTTNTMTTTNNSNLSPTKEQITRPRRSSSPLAFLSKKFGRKKTTNGCLEDHQHHHQHSKSDPNSPPTPSNSPVDLYILQQYSKDMNGNNNNNNNNTSSSLPNNNVNNNNNVQQQQQQSFQPISLSPKHRSSSSSSSSSHRRNSSTSSSSSSSTTSFSPTLETSAFTLISSFSSLSSSSSININQLPHTIILKIIGYLANLKMDEKNNEIKLDRSRPDLPTLSTSTNSSPPLVSSTTSNNSLDLTSSTNNNNNIGSIPNLELETLSMTDTQTAIVMAQAMQSNHECALESLALDRLGDAGGAAILESLCDASHPLALNELLLTDSKLSLQTAQALSRAISTPTCRLADAIFRCNLIGCAQIDIPSNGGTLDDHLFKSIALNQTITRLSLADNRIPDEMGSHLAKALRDNTAITSLSLSLNRLGALFASELSEALVCNQTLLMLDLSNNQLDYDCGRQLMSGLLSNHALRLLNLSQNPLSSKIGQVIASTLIHNSTLTQLELSYVGLGTEGAVSLASQPLPLIKLNLSENQIQDQGGLALANSLQHNKYLQVLDLSYNSFTYRVKERFEKQQNDQHKHLSQLSLSSIPLNWKFQL